MNGSQFLRRAVEVSWRVVPLRSAVVRIIPALQRFVPTTARGVQSYGCRFDLDLRDYVERSIFWQTYEPVTLAMWNRGVGAGDVVIDVGANVGVFSLIAARNGASVHSFEPSAVTRARLQANLDSNEFGSRVSVVPYAANDIGGTALLFQDIHADSAWRNVGVASMSNQNAGGAGTEIQCITIDDYVATARLERVSWIKLDIQGAELMALRGASGTMTKFRPRILVEFDPVHSANMGWGQRELDQFFEAHDYQLSCVEARNYLATPRGAASR